MKTLIHYAGALIFMLCMYLTSSGAANSAQHWMPARAGAVAFSIEEKGYLGTGAGYQNSTLIFQKDFWEYDPETDAWTQKASLSGSARYYAVGFSIGKKGYIGTGFNGDGIILGQRKDFWEYDPGSNTWTKKADFGGSARSAAVGFSIGDKGYIGTGFRLDNLRDFWEYDPASDSWVQIADLPGISRYGAVSFSIGDRGYVGTGVNSTESEEYLYLGDFYEYDPAMDTWTPKATFEGMERAFSVGFSSEMQGYIGTGKYMNRMKNDFWGYDPGSDSWTRKPDFCGDARSGAACFSLNEKGFIVTGNTKSNVCFQDMWEYNINKRDWTRKADLGKISLYHKGEKIPTDIIPVSNLQTEVIKTNVVNGSRSGNRHEPMSGPSLDQITRAGKDDNKRLLKAGPVNDGQSITLNFTAVNNASYLQLDSIKVINQTQGGEVVLWWPDTMLTILWVGIQESRNMDGFRLYQNYPNPAGEQTCIDLYMSEPGQVSLIMTDRIGRMVLNRDMSLPGGMHTLICTPGKDAVYFLTAIWNGFRQSITILHPVAGTRQQCSIEYAGFRSQSPVLKSLKDSSCFMISPGDELLFIGYKDDMESGILGRPENNETVTFQFITNSPCPEMPTVEYAGKIYHTIQIFSQCWLRENLNVGVMISGDQDMADNGMFEKYCYDNLEENCTLYGGLYQWNELMKYTTGEGTQGICPSGWHVPSDEEWKVLEGAADSLFRIGASEWNSDGSMGYDAGLNLKTTFGWNYGGNGTDLFNFSGLPGGDRDFNGYFGYQGSYGLWWTSTEGNTNLAYVRNLYYGYQEVGQFYTNKGYGFSVRCIKDY